MFSASQFVAHLVGDYLLQSDWMAQGKTARHLPAFAHAFAYGLPFLCLRPSLAAWAVIVASHFLLDRWRLARYVCWAKNFLAPRGANAPWAECWSTGSPNDRPAWLSVWLMILADNTIHLLINGAALRWL